MKRAGLVSDTHGLMREEVLEALAGVERIFHLGDVGGPGILDELRRIAPLSVVRGNVDHGSWADTLPATDLVAIFGANVYMLHNLAHLDLDPAAAEVKIVLYGHTHTPKTEEKEGVRYINPGSIGPCRFRLPVSWAYLNEDLTVDFVS